MKFYQTYLANELSERKAKNPHFSLRAFAKLVGMSAGQLSKLISGKSGMTASQATKIIESLNPVDADANMLLQSVHPLLGLKRELNEFPKPIILRDDEFKLISDWYHFAILSLCRLSSHKADPKWIADQLGIEYQTAQLALARLVRLKLIHVEDDKMIRLPSPLTTSKDISSAAIQNYHRQTLQLAIEKIDKVGVTEREYSSITTAIDPKKIKRAKKMIIAFTENLSMELSSKKPTEVYTLAVQLFPLTQKAKVRK